MPEYEWDTHKDEWLRRNRGLSFPDVVYHLEHGDLLDDTEHPNQERHPGQRLYVIRIIDYVFLVPFYRSGNVDFLVTAYPSRKYTRDYSPQWRTQ